jgi:type II secretory pathway pseudopilin PulG
LTLLETLLVVGIITLLLAILLPLLRGPLLKRQLVEATATLDSMVMALEKVKQDYQYERIFAEGDNGEKLIAYYNKNEFVKELAPNMAEWKTTYTPRLNTQRTQYMDFKRHSIKKDQVLDPWGNPYRYTVFARSSQGWTYEIEALFSDGPDRMTTTDDDILHVLHEHPSPPGESDASRPKYTVRQLEAFWSSASDAK